MSGDEGEKRNSNDKTKRKKKPSTPTSSAEKEEDTKQNTTGNKKEGSTMKNKSRDEKEERNSKKDITESKTKGSTPKSGEEKREPLKQDTPESKKKDRTLQGNSRKWKEEDTEHDIVDSKQEGSNLKSKSNGEEEKIASKQGGAENEKRHSKLKNNSDDEEEEDTPQQDVKKRSKSHGISSAKSPALEEEVQTRSAGNKRTNSPKPTTLTDTTTDVPSSPSIQPTVAETAAGKSASPPKPMTPTDTAADMPESSPTQRAPTDTAAVTPTSTPQSIIEQRMLTHPKGTSINADDNDVATDKTMNDMPMNITPAKNTEEGESLNKPTSIAATDMPANTTGDAEEAVSLDLPPAMIFGRSGRPNSCSKSETTTQTPTVQEAEDECKPPSKEKHEAKANPERGTKEGTCEKETVPESCCGSTATKCCLETDQAVHVAYRKTLSSLEDRLKRLEEQTKSIYDRLFAVDCSDLAPLKNESEPQTFYLEQGGKRPVRVLCEMETEGGGWTVVQRRDPHFTPIDFQRGWHDYKVGFGTPETEYWVGLQNLYAWTNSRQYEMRVEITDYDGNAAYAHYRRFYVEGEDQDFRLHVSGYRGTAGDALTNRNTADSFTADGMKFSTFDRDNDLANDTNCALLWKSGGWWYNCCSWSNLNGPHWRDADGSGIGINWHTWRNKEYLHTSTMMIRPSAFL
ncbi:muscle M-line assembly protein unc-89-like [Scylla paramamosain]|uniref:muscle M-line assembly protein unc-89-like n=1 Tax=Scylla paramamosain TaxID=85552 RepID=UPI0030829A2A